MVKAAGTFRCLIETPDGRVLEDDFTSAKLPALDGYIGILANRAPMTAVVTTGLITLAQPGDQSQELFVSRGFLQVRRNLLKILAEECMSLEQLDAEDAWELLQQSYRLPRETDAQRAVRDEVIYNGRIRFSLAQKARKGMMSMEQMLSRGMDRREK